MTTLSRIAMAALQAADVLLGEARNLGDLLLRQTALLPNAGKVPTDKAPHVHGKAIAIDAPQVYQL